MRRILPPFYATSNVTKLKYRYFVGKTCNGSDSVSTRGGGTLPLNVLENSFAMPALRNAQVNRRSTF